MVDNVINTPTDSNIIIDYDKLEDTFYDALQRIEEDKKVQEQIEKDKQALKSINENNSDLLEFSSSTDANLYTVETVVAPTTSEQQQLAYILDIRNILLILLLFYFAFSIYSKIKTTMINFLKNRG